MGIAWFIKLLIYTSKISEFLLSIVKRLHIFQRDSFFEKFKIMVTQSIMNVTMD